ncbi:MAG: fibronectin type III domain-containing protein [Clostridiales bacterium]|jgi:hypothetical protein|nr:fibronectin type III domain-containing protein [Clostridiales bacterium]
MKKFSKIIGKLVCFTAAFSIVAADVPVLASYYYPYVLGPGEVVEPREYDPDYKDPFIVEKSQFLKTGEDVLDFEPILSHSPGKLIVKVANWERIFFGNVTPEMFPGIDIDYIVDYCGMYAKYGMVLLALKEKTEEATLNAAAALKDSPYSICDSIYLNPFKLLDADSFSEIYVLIKDFENVSSESINIEMFQEILPGVEVSSIFADSFQKTGCVVVYLKETTTLSNLCEALSILNSNPLIEDTFFPIVHFYNVFEGPLYRYDWAELLYGPPLTEITGLEVTNASNDSISLKWDEMPGAASYQVLYNGKAATAYSSEITLEGLPSDTEYDIKVLARKINNTTDWSDTVSVTTKSSEPQIVDPPAPTMNQPYISTANANFSASFISALQSVLKTLLAYLSKNLPGSLGKI